MTKIVMLNVKSIILILVVLLITGIILYIEKSTPDKGKPGLDLGKSLRGGQNFPDAPEIVDPFGFINTDKITLGQLKGKKIVLIDFWTYSCINCQRTLPYLNAWYEKYGQCPLGKKTCQDKDKGFEIIGVHSPEFEFEKKLENVQAAVTKYGIKYPVVLDNDYATWRAYGNRYWPRKYLVNLDGKIVYDHIGEGGYDETEKKIQELLKSSDGMASPVGAISVDSSKVGSPETYLGSKRTIPSDNWSLVGDWDIQAEYAENKSAGARIIYKYKAKEVYLVASSTNGVKVKVTLDGKLVSSQKGEDVGGDGIMIIQEDRLYKVIQDKEYGQHTLELEILSPGLKAFAFTFG